MKTSVQVQGDIPELDVLGYVEAYAEAFLAREQARTPVITGRLRDSLHNENISETGFDNVSDVEYAEFVENGTYKMAPRYFVRTTVEEAESISAEVISKLFK